MCSRITQYRPIQQYKKELGWETVAYEGSRIPFYNVAPGTWPLIFHTLHKNEPDHDTVHWGYRPAWAVEKGFPQQTIARVENAMTKPFYKVLWCAGRVIVPVDGWYEWPSDTGREQPWYIRLKTDRPMLLAAITDWRPFTVQDENSGFVIVTAATDGGIVDVHDRRPVVLGSADARLWMDNTLPAEEAERLARSCPLPTDAFDWHQVSPDVNNPRLNEPYLIEPLM